MIIKVGDIVKLKNPKNGREKKRRWRVIEFLSDTCAVPVIPVEGAIASNRTSETVTAYPSPGTVSLRRLDTATHRLERNNEVNLVPISFWERITKRH